jgi:multidrug efflux pump subunit AcrA (membrane-fusion protein)
MANRRLYIVIATAVLFTLIMLFIEGCSKPEEKEAAPVVPVQAAAVKRESIRKIIQAQAILYPLDQAAITPRISAPVLRFYVNRGDHVRKGQLLAELESRDLAASVSEAKGNYDQAAANYKITTTATLPEEIVKSQSDVTSNKEVLGAAQISYESRKKLFDEGAIPRKQLDDARVAYVQAQNQYELSLKHLEALQKEGKDNQIQAAQAQVEAAKGRHEAAEAQLQYSKVYSPINGVITDRPFYAGEMASAGTTLLTVMDISTIIARANIPVGELAPLKVGESATITGPDGASAIPGKVMIVSPSLDANSTTAEVWVQSSNPGERLRPGTTVRIEVTAETIPDAIVIPISAIIPSQQSAGNRVLVAGADSLAHERKIEIGVREGDRVQVLKGLSPGEQVITVGGYGIQDKTKVKIEHEAEKE